DLADRDVLLREVSELRERQQKLLQWNGGRIQGRAGQQSLEGIRYPRVQIVRIATLRSVSERQIRKRKRIEAVADRRVMRARSDIRCFHSHLIGELFLDSEREAVDVADASTGVGEV